MNFCKTSSYTFKSIIHVDFGPNIQICTLKQGQISGGGAEAPPQEFYHVLARKIVEATVQLQLHLKHENIERVELISSRSQQEGNKGVKAA